MIATYDLRDKSASFEFFYWLVLAKARGATKIIIDASQPKINKMSPAEVLRRIENTLIPGCALAGLPVKVEFHRPIYRPLKENIWDFMRWSATNSNFERLLSPKEPAWAEYTVTLRTRQKAVNRNSNEAAWRQFAREIDAVVIEDYDVRPIHLHDRMALYAGARMNFGVCNGPIAMLGLTPYPVAMFVNTQSARNNQVKSGIPLETERFPWMLSCQRLIWKEDTIENLREAFNALEMRDRALPRSA